MSPAKSYSAAMRELTPEQRERFKAEFASFIRASGCQMKGAAGAWVKWAFFCAKDRAA